MKTRLLIFGALLALTSFALAADKDVEDLLGHMRDAYKAVKTAKFNVKATIPGPDSKDADVTAAVIYKSGDKVNVQLKGIPGLTDPLVITSNGEKIQMHGLPNGDQTLDFDRDQLSQTTSLNLETLSFWDWKKQLSTDAGNNMEKSTFVLTPSVKWNDKDYTVLEEHASNGPQPVVVKYYIDPKTFFIMRTNVFDDAGKSLGDYQISDLQLDQDVSDDTFKIG